jgi:hypothetical protein
MTKYETLSLFLTGIYDILTFLLLVFVVYEGIIKGHLANIAFYYLEMPEDTKRWGWGAQLMDFVLENLGPELKNVRIRSEPDYLGWGYLGPKHKTKGRNTSEYFSKTIPCLHKNARHQFFWCDVAHNKEVLKKPFKIIIEYDNPAFPLPRRVKKKFDFDFSTFDGTFFGVIRKYDVHNIAQENARIREEIEKISKSVEKIATSLTKSEDK